MTRRKGQLGAIIILVIFDYFLVVIWLEQNWQSFQTRI